MAERTPAVEAAVEAMVKAATGAGGVTMVDNVEYVSVPRNAVQLLLATVVHKESLSDKVFKPSELMPTMHPEQR